MILVGRGFSGFGDSVYRDEAKEQSKERNARPALKRESLGVPLTFSAFFVSGVIVAGARPRADRAVLCGVDGRLILWHGT